jgi:tripartite-type tricarboxylate transporter receptor subunit TctC
MMTRRAVLKSALLLAASSKVALPKAAETTYPQRPVNIVVPFAPGQTADILARVLADSLSKLWGGKPVFVVNKGGAGGAIGSLFVAHAAPDGYTLLLGSTGPTAIAPQMSKSAGYDSRKDFSAIIALAGVPQMMIVAANSRYKTMQDVIEDARARPDKLSYGSGGIGSLANLTMEIFKHQAGIQIEHVPYQGAGPAYADLLAGRLQVMFDTTPAAINFVRSGQMRFLAASTAQRTAVEPDVPTVSEAGLPGFNVLGWLGVLAPAGMDPTLRDRLNRDFSHVMEDAAVKQRLLRLGLSPIGGSAGDFTKYIDSEYTKFGDAIRAAGITG